MNAPRFNRDFVKAALIERAEDLFRDAWGEPERAAGKEWRAKASSAVAMIMRGPDRGLWTDHRTGEGGDLFDMIAVNRLGLPKAGTDFPRVLAAAAAWAGLSPDTVPDLKVMERKRAERDRAAQIEAKAEAAAKVDLIATITGRAQPIEGTPAEAYLKRRGIEALPAQGLAYAPPLRPQKALLHPRHAALIAWATDDRGKITGGQRILIQPDGHPAPEETRKPAFGAIQGHPARFPARIEGGPLYVAEGPESALSIWIATGAETWAVFGSSGWQAAPLPMGRQIILCPDRDAEGSPAQIAFAEAVALHLAKGRNIWIAPAPEPEGSKRDLNDTLQQAGIEAVRAALDDAEDARPKPHHPAPEGDREKAIAAHGEIPRAFFAEALPLIRATKQVQTEAEGLDPDAPDYRQRYRQIRQAARDAFGLDVLPAKTIGKAQKAPRVMLTGAQGVGKTTALVGDPKKEITGALHDATGIVSLSLFPGHAKAAEACLDYTEAQIDQGPVPLHLKGRNAQDSARPDRTMCLIPAAAEALAKRGVNVRGTLCERCPLADRCGYLEQERELKRLAASPEGVAVFAPHDYAFLPLPGDVKPDLIAFDEAPRGLGVDDVRITLDALGERLTYEGRARVKGWIKDAEARADALADELRLIRPAMIALRNAWQADRTGAGVYAELIAEGFTSDFFKAARTALSQFEAATITQDIDAAAWATQGDWDAFGRKVEKAAEAQQTRITQALGRLFETVAHEIEAGLAAPVAVVFEAGRGGQASALRIAYVRSPTFSDHAPFLHLDGTGDPDLAEAVFGPMRLERHRAERLATVTQVTGKTFSNQSITGKNKRGELIGGNVSWQAPALRRDLIAYAHSKPSALVVGNKGVIEALKAEGLQNATAHFGDLRGRNDWKDLAEIILIGREQLPPSAVELAARAFASKAGVPFQPIAGKYPEAQRALRMRSGQPVPIKTPHHSDPWADRVLTQTRDAEALQAIDRIRPMFKPVTVYVLAELCLDLTVDAVTSWTDLKAGGDLIARTVAQAGVLPLSPREAERLFPGIWTRSSASRELEPLKNKVDTALRTSAEQVSQDANSISYLQSGTLIGATLIEYRTAPKDGRRTGNKITALVWGPLSEAHAKVEAVAGPLAAFAVVPEWEAIAEALDAAEERAAIQAEAEAVSPQYAPARADRHAEAPPRGREGQDVIGISPRAKGLGRPPDAPQIVPFRRGQG